MLAAIWKIRKKLHAEGIQRDSRFIFFFSKYKFCQSKLISFCIGCQAEQKKEATEVFHLAFNSIIDILTWFTHKLYKKHSLGEILTGRVQNQVIT